jgi:hypothetical protein
MHDFSAVYGEGIVTWHARLMSGSSNPGRQGAKEPPQGLVALMYMDLLVDTPVQSTACCAGLLSDGLAASPVRSSSAACLSDPWSHAAGE